MDKRLDKWVSRSSLILAINGKSISDDAKKRLTRRQEKSTEKDVNWVSNPTIEEQERQYQETTKVEFLHRSKISIRLYSDPMKLTHGIFLHTLKNMGNKAYFIYANIA